MKTEKCALYIGNAVDILDIKTANGVYHWRRQDCVGEIARPGCTVSTGLEKISLSEARTRGATQLIIGVTPHGGALSEGDIPTVLEALTLGFTIVSGLHSPLQGFAAIRESIYFSPDKIVELRTAGEQIIGTGKKRSGMRLLTVGSDCCVGKMFTALAICRALNARQTPATFRATGQTGIMIAGEGICVDAVVSDFIAGNVEKLSAANADNHWDVIEGQGSLFHPAYAGVSLGLLHGAQADALVVCHEYGRKVIDGTESYTMPALAEVMELNLRFAHMTNPAAKIIGISMNTRRLDKPFADRICAETENEFGLPCVDIVRHGVDKLIANL